MENTERQRVTEILNSKNLSTNALAKKLGMAQTTVNNYIKGDRKISFELMQKIAIVFPDINLKWLLTGEGDMYNEHAEVYKPKAVAGIRLVSQYAYAGYLSGYGDPEYMEHLPVIDFTPDRHMTGNWLAFEVKGDSMDDGTKSGYESGEILICREVEPEFWKESRLHINSRDFVIVHAEGIIFKRVTEHDVEKHTIVVHSLNTFYKDRTIDLADVRKIFSVVESRKQRAR